NNARVGDGSPKLRSFGCRASRPGPGCVGGWKAPSSEHRRVTDTGCMPGLIPRARTRWFLSPFLLCSASPDPVGKAAGWKPFTNRFPAPRGGAGKENTLLESAVQTKRKSQNVSRRFALEQTRNIG